MPEIKYQSNTQTKYAIFILATCFAALVAGYSYLVDASVRHVVRRVSLERATSALQSEVANLEAEYFALEGAVTRELARESAYLEALNIHYVDISGQQAVVLTRNN